MCEQLKCFLPNWKKIAEFVEIFCCAKLTQFSFREGLLLNVECKNVELNYKRFFN